MTGRSRERVSAALYASPATRWIPAAARRLRGDAADLADRLRGAERPWHVPPRRLAGVGGGDHAAVGRAYVRLLRRRGAVDPSSSVLDIGCGVGRIAVALTAELGPRGRYEGFDVVPEAIEWCRREITPRHPNFRFELAELRNPRYSPGAATPAEDHRFPHADESFDLAIATSVFTHMRPRETAGYLAEARRVLRPGGRLFATWFLLGVAPLEDAERRRFRADLGDCRAISRRVPEAGLAVEEALVRQLHGEAGFQSVEVEHGGWRDRSRGRSQDLVVAAR